MAPRSLCERRRTLELPTSNSARINSMKAFGLTIATLTIASRSTIAQNISQVLTQYTQLSSLSAIIANSSALSTQLDAADNFTFLAPSNDAITAWTQSSPSDTSIDAVLAYHLLSDVINIVNFDASHRHIPPYFIPSALNDSTYTNVTGGQRVGMYYIGEMGQVEFQSGNKTISQIITAVCLLHLVSCEALTKIGRILLQMEESFISLIPYLRYHYLHSQKPLPLN